MVIRSEYLGSRVGHTLLSFPNSLELRLKLMRQQLTKRGKDHAHKDLNLCVIRRVGKNMERLQ